MDILTKNGVVLGRGVISELVKLSAGYGKIAIITDDNVASLFRRKLTALLPKAMFFVFNHGDKNKSNATLQDMYKFLQESRFNRGDLIVALGGGVVGDIAGYCASTYLRGIDYINVPTSLLAMVDSSIGGKTAINTDFGKNLIGSFYRSKATIIDTDFLLTLPSVEVSCGFSEIIKYAVLQGGELKSALDEINFNGVIELEHCEKLQSIIHCCVKYKLSLTEKDFRDNGDRQLLNLGHTIGHVVEKLSDYTISHGEAVAVGLVTIATKLSGNPEFVAKIKDMMAKFGLPTKCSSQSSVWEKVVMDKKLKGNNICLVVPRDFGRVSLVNYAIEEVRCFGDN